MRNLLTAALIILPVYAMPAHAMRCNNKLIVPGDEMQKVLEVCGDPDDVRQYETYSEQYAYHNHTHHEHCTHSDAHLIPETIEVWTYHLGTGRFTRELHFKDNRILSIGHIR